MEWINSNPSQRIGCMEELLQKIQLLECSVECLENELETHETLFMSRPTGFRLVNKVLLHFSKQAFVRQKRGAKKKSQTMLVVIGGNNDEDDLNKVCWKLSASLQFEELCKIPGHPLRFGVCKIPDGFVLTGGDNSTMCSMYVLSTNSWKQLKTMKSARCSHGSIFMNGRIFVFGGGETSDSESSSVHSLALDGNQWDEEADIPNSVRYPEVASVENSIFLLDVVGNQLLHLDMKTKKWSPRQNLPGPRCYGARMIVVKGQLLVAGSNRKIAAQYDLKTDTWCTLKSPALPHGFGALVGLDKKVYLIGGSDDCIEECNLDTETWTVCKMYVPKNLLNLHALALDF